MKGSFANRVREAAQSLRAQGRTFTVDDLAEKMEIQEYSDKARIRNVVWDFIKSGEMQKVSKGVYTHVGKLNPKPSKQKVMWNYFRMRMKCGSSVTAEELQAAANASAEYVREWLSFLVRIEYAKDHGNGRFQLLKDPVEMPLNEKKAEKLRNIRKNKQKEVMDILEEIKKAFARLEETVSDLAD